MRGYLLSPTHAVGQYKAAFFNRMGYTRGRWRDLERDLREQHLCREAEELGASRYGRKFRIRGPLQGPSGMRVEFISIWIIRTGDAVPRFVTAYPEGG